MSVVHTVKWLYTTSCTATGRFVFFLEVGYTELSSTIARVRTRMRVHALDEPGVVIIACTKGCVILVVRRERCMGSRCHSCKLVSVLLLVRVSVLVLLVRVSVLVLLVRVSVLLLLVGVSLLLHKLHRGVPLFLLLYERCHFVL